MRLMLDDAIDLAVIIMAGVLVVGLFIAMGIAASNENEKHDRLMAQCMADGKKEYECEAMLKSGKPLTTVVPTPMVIK